MGSGHHGCCELENIGRRRSAGERIEDEERERERTKKKNRFIKDINVNSRDYVVSFQKF